jgi:hypothetical protein
VGRSKGDKRTAVAWTAQHYEDMRKKSGYTPENATPEQIVSGTIVGVNTRFGNTGSADRAPMLANLYHKYLSSQNATELTISELTKNVSFSLDLMANSKRVIIPEAQFIHNGLALFNTTELSAPCLEEVPRLYLPETERAELGHLRRVTTIYAPNLKQLICPQLTRGILLFVPCAEYVELPQISLNNDTSVIVGPDTVVSGPEGIEQILYTFQPTTAESSPDLLDLFLNFPLDRGNEREFKSAQSFQSRMSPNDLSKCTNLNKMLSQIPATEDNCQQLRDIFSGYYNASGKNAAVRTTVQGVRLSNAIEPIMGATDNPIQYLQKLTNLIIAQNRRGQKSWEFPSILLDFSQNEFFVAVANVINGFYTPVQELHERLSPSVQPRTPPKQQQNKQPRTDYTNG